MIVKDENKTKAQLITELKQARKRITEIGNTKEHLQPQEDKFRILAETFVFIYTAYAWRMKKILHLPGFYILLFTGCLRGSIKR